jgi:hypothetical protein
VSASRENEPLQNVLFLDLKDAIEASRASRIRRALLLTAYHLAEQAYELAERAT